MTTKADQLVSTALSQLGTTEDPPNSNMQPYGEAYGMNGVAWCCIFVWWCAQRAGVTFPQTAYVPTLETWARDNGVDIPADQIQRGDVICLDYSWPMGDGADHVEIALGPPGPDGRIPCVGGNTSDASDVGGSIGNGGGVYVNSRPLSWVSTAIRLPRSDEIIDQEDDDMTIQVTWLDPAGTRWVMDTRTGQSCTAQDASPDGWTGAQAEADTAELIAAGVVRDLGRMSWGANWRLRKSVEIQGS